MDVAVGFGHLLHARNGLLCVFRTIEGEVILGEEGCVVVAQTLHEGFLFAVGELIHAANGKGECLFLLLVHDAVSHGYSYEQTQGTA